MSSIKTFKDWEPAPVCALCGRSAGLEKHHKKFRSQGGNDRAENLVKICRICHGAAHGIRLIEDGFSCETCPRLEKFGCYLGERLLRREIVSEPPWKGA